MPFEDEELEALRLESTHTIDIEKFVPRSEIDERYLDSPYYLVPEDKVGQDAFAVIREPLDVVRGVTVFGQNELAELARSPEKLTALLYRFVAPDKGRQAKHVDVQARLGASRRDILECRSKAQRMSEQLAALPGLKETLERYRKAGVEEKLKSRDTIVRAEAIVEAANDAIEPIRGLSDELSENVALDTGFLGDDALKGLPAEGKLKSLKGTLSKLEAAVRKAQRSIDSALDAGGCRAVLGNVHRATATGFAEACRKGAQGLVKEFGIPASQAERLETKPTDPGS